MILEKGQKPSLSTQRKNILKSLKCLVPLFRKAEIVITHGNGPQVGNIMIRSDIAKKEAYPISLDVGVAQSEGEMGYLIASGLSEVLREKGIKRNILSVLTQVEVDGNDTAMRNPSKPVGPYLSVTAAKEMKRQGKQVAKIAKGWRRVVPSPKPKKIIENAIIMEVISKNTIIIAGGGGGIPVVKKNRSYKGIEAVIDKDATSVMLANAVQADTMIILTDVANVFLDYGKKSQEKLLKVSKDELRRYRLQGHFPPGTMGPKIDAVLAFKGKRVIITNPQTLSKSLKNRGGTIVE